MIKYHICSCNNHMPWLKCIFWREEERSRCCSQGDLSGAHSCTALTPEDEPRWNTHTHTPQRSSPGLGAHLNPHTGGRGGSAGCRLNIAVTWTAASAERGNVVCLYAAMSEFLVSLLGERLVNSEKAELDVQSLGAKLSLVGLFFGCSLNAPCKQFNGSLCEFYSRFKKASEHKDKLEIVFISSDQDQKHWQDFLQEMPWPALPFKDRHKKVRWAVVMSAGSLRRFLLCLAVENKPPVGHGCFFCQCTGVHALIWVIKLASLTSL